MGPDCRTLIVERIRQSGPLTIADYMDLALYAPGLGYYARAAQRSGRAGDFVTSVDVGPVFGELLAARFADMAGRLVHDAPDAAWDLVEVAAGNGRLARDVLDALVREHPDLCTRLRLTLVERSAEARAAHGSTLGPHASRLAGSTPELPASIRGVIFANELLDAMPVHVVEMTPSGLAEVYVDARHGDLVEHVGPLSRPELADYFDSLGMALEPGARADVNLAALGWIQDVAGRLDAGYLVLIDYGFEAGQLFGGRAVSTLRTFHRHLVDTATTGASRRPPWLLDPGSRDLTTHVDFTSVRRAAEHAGLTTFLDEEQSRFLLDAAVASGLLAGLEDPGRLRERLALKSLLVPGGMGSTHRVVVFGRHAPPLSSRG